MKLDLTSYLTIGITAFALLWDAYLQINGGEVNTLSARWFAAMRKYPIIAFLFGALAGHLVWLNCSHCVCP